jgi:hypothetical protein
MLATFRFEGLDRGRRSRSSFCPPLLGSPKCRQRLTSRVPERTNILPSLADSWIYSFCLFLWRVRVCCPLLYFCGKFYSFEIYVWIPTQRSAVSSRRANNLTAIHLVNLDTHLGLICTVVERSRPPDLGGVAQLRFFGVSSYLYIVNVHKILPPAGVITLADSWCLSALRPNQALVS